MSDTQADNAVATPDRPGDANASNTISYADLSEEGKAAFRAARTGHARFIRETEYVDGDPFDPDAFDQYVSHSYVERNGTYYEVVPSVGEAYASYNIVAEPANASVADVTPIDDLPADVRSEVRWAVENGSYEATLGKWTSLPAPLSDVGYVRADGDVYRLSVAVGDWRVQRIHLERIE